MEGIAHSDKAIYNSLTAFLITNRCAKRNLIMAYIKIENLSFSHKKKNENIKVLNNVSIK